MSFLNKFGFLKKPPLKIEEKDLSKIEGIEYETEIPSDLLKPDVSKEALETGLVIFPVLRDQPVLPLQIGAKFCDYERKNYGGGLIEIVQRYGKEEPNPVNEQYPKEVREADKKPISFYFYYDDEKKRYVNIKDEEVWQEKLNEINVYKSSPEVKELLKKYYEFAKENIMQPGLLLPKAFTYKEMYAHCFKLQKYMKLVTDYHDFLYVFGDIEDDLYESIQEQIEIIKNRAKEVIEFIEAHHVKEIDSRYQAGDSYIKPGTGSQLYIDESIKWFIIPGYILDRTHDRTFKNIGEVFYVIQIKGNHETVNSRKEWLKEQLSKFKATSNIKSNRAVTNRNGTLLPITVEMLK